MKLFFTVIALLPLHVACSATPGDAAMRSGHYEAAAKLYEKVANQGDPIGAQKLAELYSKRPGLTENHQQAITWYKRAFELGNIRSAWEIGTIYYGGTGNVPRDAPLAQQWFEKGAEQGHHYSMYALADMYADNSVTPGNDTRGLMWLNAVTTFAEKASPKDEGHLAMIADRRHVRSRLEGRMTPAQIAEARKLAADWLAHYQQKTGSFAR